MPESIIIHFREHDTAEITDRIKKRLTLCSDLLSVERYAEFDTEYEPCEKAMVRSILGGEPTISFDFAIRRSRSDDACDRLERFMKEDLSGLNFVVDDNIDRIISPLSPGDSRGFLDAYRDKMRGSGQADQT